MNAPIFLCLFLGVAISLNYVIRREYLKRLGTYDDYLDREREANMNIGGKLDDSMFIKPDTSALPYREYESTQGNNKIIKMQEQVRRKADFKMICLDKKYTNTQLKLKYGVNNLDKITDYEENYNFYIRALVDWGRMLIELDNLKDAETVLNEAVRFGSDLSANYILLADVYLTQNNMEGLDELRVLVEQSELQMKDKILAHIRKQEEIS